MRRLRALVVIGALVLAGQAAARSAGPATTYKVKRGDTLSRIARRHHTTVEALTAANALANPNRIFAGQVLSLAPPAAPPAPSTGSKPGAPQPIAAVKPAPGLATSDAIVVVGLDGQSSYVVRKGDTLSAVATRYSTTVADLTKLNNIKSHSVLRIGQSLAVPGGGWTCPVAGPHSFGDSWRQPREGGRQHMGTDVFAARGTPVVAPVAGTLTYRNGAIGGLAFYLDGVDGVTYYGAHMTTQTAPTGPIKAGAPIGTVGNTGNAAGGATHLHFEIHPKGVAVNPYPTLKRWC
ncbi:MAG: hypothetical protein QOK43_3309 [Acidimicrobiaceae bacterium]|nr:hypothetical protein [Acidimicrobiaceae bacterium]